MPSMLQPRNPKCSVKTLNSVALEVIKFFEYGDTVLVLLRRARLFVFGHFSLNSTVCNYCATWDWPQNNHAVVFQRCLNGISTWAPGILKVPFLPGLDCMDFFWGGCDQHSKHTCACRVVHLNLQIYHHAFVPATMLQLQSPILSRSFSFLGSRLVSSKYLPCGFR